jgi:hypothetical protein
VLYAVFSKHARVKNYFHYSVAQSNAFDPFAQMIPTALPFVIKSLCLADMWS